MMNKFELEERLINFSVLVVEIVNEMPNTKAGNLLSGQLISIELWRNTKRRIEKRFHSQNENCFKRIT
ncbi:MAG: hypothetical protein PVH88_20955 [Ignavibacteria bacterium]|jgi:hypothetical protein